MRTIGLDVHERFAEVAILAEGPARPLRRRIDVTPTAAQGLRRDPASR